MRYANFEVARNTLARVLLHAGSKVKTERWQALDVSKDPSFQMVETLFAEVSVAIETEDLESLRSSIGPNLPWADDHFVERVSGRPINPGLQWRYWPYAHSADRHRVDGGQFNHNYMERYWPRHAARFNVGTDTVQEFDAIAGEVWGPGWDDRATGVEPAMGLRAPYGDLQGVVRLLANEPTTRQAYMPVWFPEDTGDAHNGRKPCSIGYHFIMRDAQLHVTYHIRSCDFVRHYRDDVYLTVRLLLWVLNECRKLNPKWEDVRPGLFNMYIGSLHCFVNDVILIRKDLSPP
jgi:hypothetical protein